MKNILAAKIRARNNLNNTIKLIAPQFLEALKPLVGQKIILATGELSAKAKTIIAPFTASTSNLQIYRHASGYSLVYVFKVSEMCSEFSCVYQEEYVYFGGISNGVLTQLNEFNSENYIDFEEAKICETRNEIEKLEEQISNLKNSIRNFEMYDNN